MPRANAMVPTEAIRIEDEVWQEAFTRREPGRSSRERRLRPVEREYADWMLEATGEPTAEATSWSLPSRTARRLATPMPDEGEPEDSIFLTPLTVEEDLSDAFSAASSESAAAAAPDAVGPALAAAAASADASSAVASPPAPARRTVKIQGRGAERNMSLSQTSRRPPRRAYERTGFRPDRVAMWAVLLGFALVLVAIVSAH